MFVRAQSKQRFGDIKEPYINVDAIVSVEAGHEGGNVTVKMSNGEEMVVNGEQAKKLVMYLERQMLQ